MATLKAARRQCVDLFMARWIDMDEGSQSIGQLVEDPDFPRFRIELRKLKSLSRAKGWVEAVEAAEDLTYVVEREWLADWGYDKGNVMPFVEDLGNESQRRSLQCVFKHCVWSAGYLMVAA